MVNDRRQSRIIRPNQNSPIHPQMMETPFVMAQLVRKQLEEAGGKLTPEERAKHEKMLAEFDLQVEKDRKQAERGRRNIYTCGKCYGIIVTIDRDEGTTPFMIGCLATKDCDGMMQSSMYRVFDQRMEPQVEWYKPSPAETAGLSAPTQKHVEAGGLILRPLVPKAPGAPASG